MRRCQTLEVILISLDKLFFISRLFLSSNCLRLRCNSLRDINACKSWHAYRHMYVLMSRLDMEDLNIKSMHTTPNVHIDAYVVGCYFMNWTSVTKCFFLSSYPFPYMSQARQFPYKLIVKYLCHFHKYENWIHWYWAIERLTMLTVKGWRSRHQKTRITPICCYFDFHR